MVAGRIIVLIAAPRYLQVHEQALAHPSGIQSCGRRKGGNRSATRCFASSWLIGKQKPLATLMESSTLSY